MAKKKKQVQQQCLEAAARKNRQERRKRNDKKEREKEKRRKKQEKERKRQKNIPHTAQQSIPYQRMFADGICQVSKNFFSKTVQFYDMWSGSSSGDGVGASSCRGKGILPAVRWLP